MRILFRISLRNVVPHGLSVAAMVPGFCAALRPALQPKSSWWMFILAPLPIRLMTSVPEGTPLWFLLACFLNDSLKGLLSAFLLRRRADSGLWFDNVSAFARYVLIAVVFSPALSALAGAATRAALDEKFWTAWTQWFLGDALASLVVTPVLFCFLRDFDSVSQAKPKRHVELMLLATTLILASAISFSAGKQRIRASIVSSVLARALPDLGSRATGPCGYLSYPGHH